MDLFYIKKRKRLKEEALREQQLAKEIEAKARIRRTLNTMKSKSKKLDEFKESYIKKARDAKLINNAQSYNMAKQGLKLVLAKQRYLDSMITNFEIAMETNEMNKIINEFVSGMSTIAEDLKMVTTNLDISKAQEAYNRALVNNETQYQALDAFLQEAEASVDSFSSGLSDIGDDEIDKMIQNQAIDKESSVDNDIEKSLKELQKKMK